MSINSSYALDHGIDPNEVIVGIESLIENQPYVKQVWTVEEIMGGDGEIAGLYRNSYVEEKSGDLFLQFHPSCFLTSSGASHGTPYEFDRNIPLVFYGRAIKPGMTDAIAHSVDIATTLADILRVSVPANVDGRRLVLD